MKSTNEGPSGVVHKNPVFSEPLRQRSLSPYLHQMKHFLYFSIAGTGPFANLEMSSCCGWNTTLHTAALLHETRFIPVFHISSFQRAHFRSLIQQFPRLLKKLLYNASSTAVSNNVSTVSRLLSLPSHPVRDIAHRLCSQTVERTSDEPDICTCS